MSVESEGQQGQQGVGEESEDIDVRRALAEAGVTREGLERLIEFDGETADFARKALRYY